MTPQDVIKLSLKWRDNKKILKVRLKIQTKALFLTRGALQHSILKQKPLSSYKSSNSNFEKCFKSQSFSHIVANYPNRRVVSFIDEASNEKYGEEEDIRDTSDDGHLCGQWWDVSSILTFKSCHNWKRWLDLSICIWQIKNIYDHIS